jgi:hypothetical protein
MKGNRQMIRSSHIAIATAVALCASPAALCASPAALAEGRGSTIHDSASVNCGGSGVNSLYCIPQQSVFTFNRVGKAAHCSIQVNFTVEPKIQGLSGHAHLELKGASRLTRGVERTARPLVGGGRYGYKFEKLSGGDYRLTGWYEGDGTRLASTHHTKHFTLRCG